MGDAGYLMDVASSQRVVRERPFHVAVLQGDVRCAQKFFEQQKNRYLCSTEFDPGHAACISDNVQMLQLVFFFAQIEQLNLAILPYILLVNGDQRKLLTI